MDTFFESAQPSPMAEAWHPKKYWWVVAVVVPVAVALVAVLPSLLKRGGDDSGSEKSGNSVNANQSGSGNVQQVGGININLAGSDLSQKMYFVADLSDIDAQFKKATGNSLTEEIRTEIRRAIQLATAQQPGESAAVFQKLAETLKVPALYNNLAKVQAQAGDVKAARLSTGQALALNPADAGANLNLGLLDASEGKLATALPALQKAAALPEGKAFATAVQSELSREQHTVELEPNDNILRATRGSVGAAVQGTIADPQDVDFFEFKTPGGSRDVIEVSFKNRSTTLAPGLHVYNADKSRLDNKENSTPGADLRHRFSANPEAVYYISVARSPYGAQQGGDYTLSFTPLKKQDRFEPNEDLLSAKPISPGSPVEADIMDGEDKDFFKFTTSAQTKGVRISLENRSTTLAPEIHAYNADKAHLEEKTEVTAGANASHLFKATPNSIFYFSVSRYRYGPLQGGAYTVLVKEE